MDNVVWTIIGKTFGKSLHDFLWSEFWANRLRTEKFSGLWGWDSICSTTTLPSPSPARLLSSCGSRSTATTYGHRYGLQQLHHPLRDTLVSSPSYWLYAWLSLPTKLLFHNRAQMKHSSSEHKCCTLPCKGSSYSTASLPHRKTTASCRKKGFAFVFNMSITICQ